MLDPQRLRGLLDADGGFTLDPRTACPVQRGMSVCMDPGRSTSFPRWAWDESHVLGWLQAHAGELQRRGRYLGGWVDPEHDRVWLDVVRVLPSTTRPLAELIGRWHRQHCLFDLGEGRLVPLAGRS